MRPGHYLDLRALPVEPKCILVIRSDDRWDPAHKTALENAIREAQPEWAGFILYLRTDQSLERLERDTLQALLDRLDRPA